KGNAPTRLRDLRKGMVRLQGEVPAALSSATKLPRAAAADRSLTLTIVLNRTDQPGFEAFLRGAQDPQSPSYGHYLSQREQADRFGPSPLEYKVVLDWLRRKRFTLAQGSANRLTITIRGTR